MRKTIRELRLARGWMQIDLARKTQICNKRISKFELGKLGPLAQELDALADALGVLPHELDVPPARAAGGQPKIEVDMRAAFRHPAPVMPTPSWTSSVRLGGLRSRLPYFMRGIESQLAAWHPFLREVPSEAGDETLFQLIQLKAGAGTTQVSTDWMRFDKWPVCDEYGAGAGGHLRPALITEHWIMVFQVSILTPKRYRMDALVLVLDPQRTHINLEVDGRNHDPVADRERDLAIGMVTLRIPADELLKGPTLTERLRALGYCLPRTVPSPPLSLP